MRSFVTLGVLSLLGAAALASCGDDDPSGGTGGSAGTGTTAGAGGARAGAGGMAGSGTAGTPTGGMGGAGGQTADVTPQATCTGCVELIVPAVGPNDNGVDPPVNVADQVGFQFAVAAPGADMTNGVLTWRIAAVAPNADTFVTLYAQNGMALGYAGAYLTRALAPAAFAANTFVDVVFDLASIGGAAGGDAGAPVGDAGDAGGGAPPAGTPPTVVGTFDKSQIIQYGITVGVGATFTGSTTVRVAVDSVTVAGVPGQASKTFDTTAEGLAINMYQVPPGTPAPFPHPAP